MPLRLSECWILPITPAPRQVIDAHCLPGPGAVAAGPGKGPVSTHGGQGCDARHERLETGFRLQLG